MNVFLKKFFKPKPTPMSTWLENYLLRNVREEHVEYFKRAFISLYKVIVPSPQHFNTLVRLTWEYLRIRASNPHGVLETPSEWLFKKQGFKCGEEHAFLVKKQQQFRTEKTRRVLEEQAYAERLKAEQKGDLEAKMWKVRLNYLDEMAKKRVLKEQKKLEALQKRLDAR